MKRLTPLLQDEGFEVDGEALPEGFGALGWAHRSRKLTDDYLFVFEGLDSEAFAAAHQRARKFANARFRLPRALRIRSPHVLSVLVTDIVDGKLKRFVERTPIRGVLGGETLHLMVLDLRQRQLHHQTLNDRMNQNAAAMHQHIGLGAKMLATLV